MNERIDRTLSLRFRSFGVVVEVRTNKPELLTAIQGILPPEWKATNWRPQTVFAVSARSSRRLSLFRDGELRLENVKINMLLDALGAGIRQYVAEMSPRRVFVHSGVVALNGSAILIPGRTHSGKTTLVGELIRLGATYYSDEYAVLDAQGRVHPYSSPLAIRRKGRPLQARVAPESLGAKVGIRPIPVGLVVVTRYVEQAQWRPRVLTAGSGALELLANTVPARRNPDRVMSVLGRAVSHARILKSLRGDARQTAERLFASLCQG